MSYSTPKKHNFNTDKKDESILRYSHFVIRCRYLRSQNQCRTTVKQGTPIVTQMLIKEDLEYDLTESEVKYS